MIRTMIFTLHVFVNVCEFLYSKIYAHFVVNRVHWLRARAQRQRWQEELILVGHEMKWTVMYFRFQSRVWNERRDVAEEMGDMGAAAYAARKEAMWREMALNSSAHFKNVNHLYNDFN
jgi:hypothetical protein